VPQQMPCCLARAFDESCVCARHCGELADAPVAMTSQLATTSPANLRTPNQFSAPLTAYPAHPHEAVTEDAPSCTG
jgi:hypothetical protein